MKTPLFSFIVFAGLLMGLGCQAPASEQSPSPEESKAALTSTFDAYNAAFQGEDQEALIAFYADDAVRMFPDTADAVGKEAIVERMGDFREKHGYQSQVTTHDIQVSGDMGAVRASFRDSWWPKAGGDTSTVEGKWLTVWKRQDGSWKLATELWSEKEIEK